MPMNLATQMKQTNKKSLKGQVTKLTKDNRQSQNFHIY